MTSGSTKKYDRALERIGQRIAEKKYADIRNITWVCFYLDWEKGIANLL